MTHFQKVDKNQGDLSQKLSPQAFQSGPNGDKSPNLVLLSPFVTGDRTQDSFDGNSFEAVRLDRYHWKVKSII